MIEAPFRLSGSLRLTISRLPVNHEYRRPGHAGVLAPSQSAWAQRPRPGSLMMVMVTVLSEIFIDETEICQKTELKCMIVTDKPDFNCFECKIKKIYVILS